MWGSVTALAESWRRCLEKGLTNLTPLFHFLSCLFFIYYLLFPSRSCTRCSSGPAGPQGLLRSVQHSLETMCRTWNQCPIVEFCLWLPTTWVSPVFSFPLKGSIRVMEHLHLEWITPLLYQLLCLHGLTLGMLSPSTLAEGSDSLLSSIKAKRMYVGQRKY